MTLEFPEHKLCDDPACIGCNAQKLENLKKSNGREQLKFGDFTAWTDPEASTPKTILKPASPTWKSTDELWLKNESDKTLGINIVMADDLPLAKIFSFEIEGEGIAKPGQVLKAVFVYDPKRAPGWAKDLDREGDMLVLAFQFGIQTWQPSLGEVKLE